MPLTLRPYTANTYAISKVWFKCSSIHISTINSKVKSWLYQDCLEKHRELALYRKPEDGGLGLFNVKIRALALLIRTFLEISTNPTFRQSLLSFVFCFHYPTLAFQRFMFFEEICHYHLNSPLNILRTSTKEWYRVLLEDNVLMSQPTEDFPARLLPIRAEILSPELDWT
jgi:hypothetical protein